MEVQPPGVDRFRSAAIRVRPLKADILSSSCSMLRGFTTKSVTPARAAATTLSLVDMAV